MNNLVTRINQTNHVKTPINSTMEVSRQVMYNKLFHAIPTYEKPNLIGNENKLELLVAYNVHVSITRHCLKQLASKGNMNAMELLNNINHTVSIEDLTQEVLLQFVELFDSWKIDNTGKVEFLEDTAILEIFKSVSGYLRKFQTKHYKHQYIEIDGNIVDANKVSALADYVSIDDLLEDITLQQFLNTLPEFDKQWLELRLDGLSNSKIALALNVTYEKIRACEKRVRKQWNNEK